MRAWWPATALALLLAFGGESSGQNRPTTVAIATSAPLSFGSITGAGGGTVTIAPDGTRSAAGVFPVGGSFGAATFTVTMSQGNPHYMITLPASTTLTSTGGATMTVDTFRSVPDTQGRVQPPARVDTLAVGATLRVAPTQQPGTYTGLFQVTVNL